MNSDISGHTDMLKLFWFCQRSSMCRQIFVSLRIEEDTALFICLSVSNHEKIAVFMNIKKWHMAVYDKMISVSD